MSPAARRWLYLWRQLAPSERRALLREAGDARRGTLPEWRPALRRARTVSFICHGNIIRSPFAAAAFARLVRERGLRIDVISAGVAARAGEPADPRAAASAAELGAPLDAHRATPLDLGHVHQADVLVVMDRLNLARILARGEGRCLFGFMSWQSWAFVVFMMAFGRVLRHSALTAPAVGPLYLAVGVALVVGSAEIWRARRVQAG